MFTISERHHLPSNCSNKTLGTTFDHCWSSLTHHPSTHVLLMLPSKYQGNTATPFCSISLPPPWPQLIFCLAQHSVGYLCLLPLQLSGSLPPSSCHTVKFKAGEGFFLKYKCNDFNTLLLFLFIFYF